jgi:hypothetical protein
MTLLTYLQVFGSILNVTPKKKHGQKVADIMEEDCIGQLTALQQRH